MVLQIKHVVVVGGGESGEKGYHTQGKTKVIWHNLKAYLPQNIYHNSLLISVVFSPPLSPPHFYCFPSSISSSFTSYNNRNEEKVEEKQ